MNYPKPEILSKIAAPVAVGKPAYSFVPQYQMSYVLALPKKKSGTWLFDDDEEEETAAGSVFGTGWKRIALMVLVGIVIVAVLPTVVRMINRRR